jgi:universal stress protein A
VIELKRILVPTDLSEFSRSAVRYGAELAHRFDSELILLHVIWHPLTDYAHEVKGDYSKSFDEFEAEILAAAESEMAAFNVEPLPNRDRVTTETRVGHPLEQITHYAEVNDVDLIVIGTHGRTGLKQVFLGSVAEKTVRHAPCPVLTVRDKEHEFVHP